MRFFTLPKSLALDSELVLCAVPQKWWDKVRLWFVTGEWYTHHFGVTYKAIFNRDAAERLYLKEKGCDAEEVLAGIRKSFESRRITQLKGRQQDD